MGRELDEFLDDDLAIGLTFELEVVDEDGLAADRMEVDFDRKYERTADDIGGPDRNWDEY
jgi:hypothetical protein